MYQKIDRMVKYLELHGGNKLMIKNMVYMLKCYSKFYNYPLKLLGE